MQTQEIVAPVSGDVSGVIPLNANSNLFFDEAMLDANKHALKRLIVALLREFMFPYCYENRTLIFDFEQANHHLLVSGVQLFSLLRFINFDSVVLVDKRTSSQQVITEPIHLFDIIKTELGSMINPERWDRVCYEITNHVQNAVFSQQKKYQLKTGVMLALEKDVRYCDFFSYFFHSCKASENSSLRFEQIVFSGHPYHVCAKTKLGFSKEDVLRYSPEFSPKVPVILAAVHKRVLHIEQSKGKPDFLSWFVKHYPQVFSEWSSELRSMALDTEDYIPCPVHPWQSEHILPKLLAAYILRKDVILFQNITLNMSPTLSCRTLAPLEDVRAPYMKLPIAIQATSIVRTIASCATEDVPKITSVLEEILNREDHFSGILFILPEYYGLHLKDSDEEKARNLAVIFRENINNYLENEEIAIVVAAFFEKISPSNRSFFVELLELAGCLGYSSALDYFYSYVDMILSSYLDLYLLYGIALEGHQQNTLILFKNARVSRVMDRDFGGSRIHRSTLERRGIQYKSHPGSPIVTEDKNSTRNTLLHAVYQMHLGELVLLLAEHFSCDEMIFWNIVKDITRQRFDKLKDRLEMREWRTEYDAILKHDWPIKALLRMRLAKTSRPENLFSFTANPFVT